MIIGVIGAGEPTPEIYSLAETVGKELGKRGVTLVCGGLGGVMEAACRGAKKAGGTTIGVLPGNDKSSANPWVDVTIPTGMGHSRNVIIVKTAEVIIAVGGAYGTLSEIGHSLAEQVPVVGLKTWEIFREGQKDKSITIAESPADAVEKAMNMLNESNLVKK